MLPRLVQTNIKQNNKKIQKLINVNNNGAKYWFAIFTNPYPLTSTNGDKFRFEKLTTCVIYEFDPKVVFLIKIPCHIYFHDDYCQKVGRIFCFEHTFFVFKKDIRVVFMVQKTDGACFSKGRLMIDDVVIFFRHLPQRIR